MGITFSKHKKQKVIENVYADVKTDDTYKTFRRLSSDNVCVGEMALFFSKIRVFRGLKFTSQTIDTNTKLVDNETILITTRIRPDGGYDKYEQKRIETVKHKLCVIKTTVKLPYYAYFIRVKEIDEDTVTFTFAWSKGKELYSLPKDYVFNY